MRWVLRVLLGVVLLVLLLAAGLWLVGQRPGAGMIELEIGIDRPARDVFQWLTDARALTRWIGGLEKIELVYAPPDGGEIGKKFRMTETYQDQRVQMEVVNTGFEKDRAITIEVSSTGDPKNGFRETAKYALAETDGRTVLRMNVQTEYVGLVPRLFEPFITPAAGRKLNEDLHRLKALVEAGPPAGAPELAPEITQLAFYTGEWAYTETYQKSVFYPQGGENTGTYSSKPGPGGNSLVNQYRTQGPAGDQEGLLVLTWSPVQKTYKAYALGSEFSGVLEETGHFEGDALVFRGETSYQGMKVKVRQVTRLAAPDRMVSQEYAVIEGAPEVLLVETLARKR